MTEPLNRNKTVHQRLSDALLPHVEDRNAAEALAKVLQPYVIAERKEAVQTYMRGQFRG